MSFSLSWAAGRPSHCQQVAAPLPVADLTFRCVSVKEAHAASAACGLPATGVATRVNVVAAIELPPDAVIA